jgi:uncharacterized DUF497 family protein
LTRFDWDEQNVAHIARHDVTPQEIEELFGRDPVLGEDESTGDELRFRAYGITAAGRLLTVPFTVRAGMVRPITAWEMSRKEKKLYAQEIYERQ